MKRTITLVLLAVFALLASGCVTVSTSGNYILGSGQTLKGDLVIDSGQATLETGSRVTGSVIMMSGDLYVETAARIEGDVIVTSGEVHRAEGAVIGGQITPNIGGYIIGRIFTRCVLPVALIGVFVGVGLFLLTGQRRRQAAAKVPVAPAKAPPALEDPTQNLKEPLLKSAEERRPSTNGEPGRYEILEKIGEGGFAIVYRARDTKLDRLVALKELRSLLLQDINWVKRFQREAKTIARLDHPRIVTVHDVYETQEQLFIVMRLVDSPGLEELITTRGLLPWSEVLKIITAVAEGLDYAHTQGILHRDLKPANILMDSERGPLLSDFGLSKLVGENSMSKTGDIVGTPHYIAPEAWEGQAATPQTDIYALGCILYEMLTGDKVFKGETPPTVMLAHFKRPELPKVWPKGVPSGVTNVLKIALAKEPADRYGTAAEMAKTLANLR